MSQVCDPCEFLKNANPAHVILETSYWHVEIGNNQAYFGRAYVTLRTHKPSLASLNNEEWSDFEAVVRRLEGAYKTVYGAEPLNWGCYMNHAFRKEPFNPHVHWHVYPRYQQGPVLDGVSYDDPLFGEFYDEKAEQPVDDTVVDAIASRLRNYLVQH